MVYLVLYPLRAKSTPSSVFSCYSPHINMIYIYITPTTNPILSRSQKIHLHSQNRFPGEKRGSPNSTPPLFKIERGIEIEKSIIRHSNGQARITYVLSDMF
ncbi:hypothetical protein OCU04_009184 [Sclerotinia nivalis]|uniref:Uncharacterized protein n=1 Tax=Sclerotinia nivalis TaxID=352851 RepID=A0A9X0AH42_9HELO|nr:hypothetical protein OCU04_009184 [Sclerotinia nivalis]